VLRLPIGPLPELSARSTTLESSSRAVVLDYGIERFDPLAGLDRVDVYAIG
jgi:hypothetical protein